MAVVRIEPGVFVAQMHDRSDSSIRDKISVLAQKVEPSQSFPTSRKGARERRGVGRVCGGRVARDSEYGDWYRVHRGLGRQRHLRTGECATVQGLCNKCAVSNWSSLVPAFLVSASRDPPQAVSTILSSLAGTDVHAGVFINILKELRDSLDGFKVALETESTSFWCSDPFRMDSAPDPIRRYDEFCSHLRERRRRRNLSAAFMALGLAGVVQSRVEQAFDIIFESCNAPRTFDIAVDFVKEVIERKAYPVAEVRHSVVQAIRQCAQGLADSRLAFSLRDLLDASV